MSAAAFRAEWTKVAKEQGILNPFKLSKEVFERQDYEIDDEGRIVLELNTGNYQRLRNEYVAKRMFQEEGFEAFEVLTQGELEYLREWPEFAPCESKEGQCNLFCAQREKCQHWH